MNAQASPDELATNRLEPLAATLYPLLDLLSDAVLVLDREGRILFANTAALRQLGCEAGWRLEQLEPAIGGPATNWAREALAEDHAGGAAFEFTFGDGRKANLALQRLEPHHWALRLQCDAPLPTAPMLPVSADQLRLVWDLPFPALLLGPDFRIAEVNAAFVLFIGFARADLIGVDPTELLVPQDRAAQRAIRDRLAQAPEARDPPRLFELRLIDAGGRERRVRVARRTLLGEAGTARILMTMQDSTAEQVARERADRSAHELDDWFDLSPVGMVLFEDSGLLVRTNRAFEALVGAVPALLGEDSPDLQQLLGFSGGQPLAQLQHGAGSLESQAWLPQREGAPRRLRAVVRRYQTPGGQRRYMAVVEDRSMEEERDLAQLQIGAVMHTAGVGLATFQESTGWLRQHAAAGGVGVGAEAVPSAALQAVGREMVLPETLSEFEKVQRGLVQGLRIEARYAIMHPELGQRWLLTRVEPATLASGERASSVVTLDITDQHHTQQRNEQLLRELTMVLESTSAGIAHVRANILVRCNRRFESMLNLPAGCAAGSDIDALFAQWPQATRVVERAAEALAERVHFETDFRIDIGGSEPAGQVQGADSLLPRVTHGGERAAPPSPSARWYTLSVRRTSAASAPIEAIAELSDITRLKAQQEELEVLARECELMFSLSEVGIAFVRDGKIHRANEAFAALTGYPVESLSDLAFEVLFIDAADFGRLWARESEQLRRSGRWSGERQLRRRDGKSLRVQVSKTLVVEGDPAGGMIASYVNVDARHRAELKVVQEAERTRAVLDSALVGIVTVDATGIVWMNRSARRMFGGDLADFFGLPIGTVATADPAHPFRQTQYLNDLFEGQTETFECRVKARDGREFWVVGNVVATGEERSSRQLTYALLDIERRRLAEARSAQTQVWLQRVIEMAPLAIALRDARTLRVLQLNQAAAAMAGRPVAELVGRTPEEMYPPAQAEAMRADMQAALGLGSLTKREYNVTIAGEPRLWEARYLPLGPPDAAPDQLLLVASDVTEQRAAQEARLEAAISQREMLVKEVHHRIKNNLQGVAGLLQQIAARKPEVESVISEVVGQVQAIAQVYGLQVGAGGPLLLHNVVEAIAGSVQRTFGRGIALTACGTEEHRWALPESESIPIALTVNELLTNAIKHSPGEGPGVQCTLTCSADGARVLIANPGQLGPDFKLARIPSGVSGLGLVRSLIPRRTAALNIEQQGESVLAILSLMPPGIVGSAAA